MGSTRYQNSLFFGLVGPLKDKFDVWRASCRVTEGQRLFHTLMVERYVQGRVQADDAAAAVIHTNEEQSTLEHGTDILKN